MAPAADKQADMQAAIDFLVGQGYRHIDLAGYSFGPWVVARWASRLPKHGHRLFLVAPPVALMDFTGIGIITGLQQVIKGSLDDPASPGLVESMPDKWHAPSRQPIIQGADHSFWGFFPHLQHIMADAIRGVGTQKFKANCFYKSTMASNHIDTIFAVTSAEPLTNVSQEGVHGVFHFAMDR